jgi:hypothetical protein
MTQPVSRRNALGMFSTVGLGALLASCTRGGDGVSSAPTTEATVETVEGGTATVSPQATGTPRPESFAAAGSGTLARELTEGPYYFDVDSIRSDIREDRRARHCVWASSFRTPRLVHRSPTPSSMSGTAMPKGPSRVRVGVPRVRRGRGRRSRRNTGPTDHETYLRGSQVTNTEGVVEFVTTYPGWYSGRTVHIHCKVHLDTTTLLTTQLFLDDAMTAEVYVAEPYSAVGRDVDNSYDSIFEDSLVLTVTAADDGYLGLITFGVDPA